MPEFFSPSDAPVGNVPDKMAALDIGANRRRLEARQRQLTETMKSMPGYGGGAQMVGGQYIPPAAADQINRFFGQVEQGYNDRELLKAGVAERAALRDSLGKLAGSDAPPDELGGGPAMPAPTGSARRAIISDLLDNPQGAQIGGSLLQDDLIEAPRRAEAAAVRASESALTRADRGEQLAADRVARAEAERLRSEDRRLSIEQRAEAARQHAALMQQMQADRAAGRSEARADRAANRTSKPLPQAVMKELSGLEDASANIGQLSTTFKPEFGGPRGALSEKLGPWVPGMDDDAALWWKDYRKQAELVERHALFGASLTSGEQGAWRSADISPGMQPKTIAANLAKRKAIADKLYQNGVDRYERSGYPGVRNAFDPVAAPQTGGAEGGWAPAATGQRLSPQQAAKLPRGTKFIGEDGVERTKR